MGDGENKETIFNEASLKVQRVHENQEIINKLRTNELIWNPAYLKYNYEIIISSLISLCYEAFPLMKSKEQEEFHMLRDIVEKLLDGAPVYDEVSVSNFDGEKTRRVLNKKNWNMLKGVMIKFEDFAREQIDSHGLAAAKRKDAGVAAIDM